MVCTGVQNAQRQAGLGKVHLHQMCIRDSSMDLLVTAFENQLDKLCQADALDVNADIAALEGMLNLDGLTGSEFTR